MNIPRYQSSLPLQKEFVTNNDASGDNIFTQVKREGPVAIYKRTTMDGKFICYEVLILKLALEGSSLPGGNKCKKTYEGYPGGSSFGKRAWACVTMKRAEERFKSLLATVKEKETVSSDQSPSTPTIDIPSGEFNVYQFASHNRLCLKEGAMKLKQLLDGKKVTRLNEKIFKKA